MVMRLRAVTLVCYTDGTAQPGAEFEERHDIVALGLIHSKQAVPAEGESAAAARQRLAESGTSVGVPLGGGVQETPGAREKPAGDAPRGTLGVGRGEPWHGWSEGRGPLEQLLGD
jgi:hypothetical protein